MSWSRAVLFEKDNTESEVVVPSKWIKGSYCYWSNSLNAKREMRDMVDIDENWPRYRVKKIKISTSMIFSNLLIPISVFFCF